MPEPTSEDWAQIRYEYEHTERPVEEICAGRGFSSGTLRDRVRRWGWTRRRAPIPAEGPPPMPPPELPPSSLPACVTSTDAAAPVAPAPAVCPCEDASPPVCDDAASIAPRLQGAVARVLPAIEAIVGRLGAQPADSREMERAARALGSLTRTLRELNTLLRQGEALPGGAPAKDDDMPADMDEFRLQLARRIEAFVASHAAANADADDPQAEGSAPAPTASSAPGPGLSASPSTGPGG